MASYHSSNFEKMFMAAIDDSKTKQFKICTAYTRSSYIKTFDSMIKDPNANFNKKLGQFLVGDPLGHSSEERKELFKKLGKKVLFCNSVKFNKVNGTFNSIIHSKIIVGYDKNKQPIWAIVGSCNFTSGGIGGNNEESMLYVDEKQLVTKISTHYDQIATMCEPLAALNLDKINVVKTDAGYSFTLKSKKNQAIDPIFIIFVLVENEDELERIKKFPSVMLDCIGPSELHESTMDGRYRPFLLVFVDNMKIEKIERLLVRYGVTNASVSVVRGAAPYSGSAQGFVRYTDNTIAIFDQKRVFDPDTQHSQGIPFIDRASTSDFDDIVRSGPKKIKMTKIINKFLGITNSIELQNALGLVSTSKKTPVAQISKDFLRHCPHNQQINLNEIVEHINNLEFKSVDGKVGYIGEGDVKGADLHRMFEFKLKSESFQEVSMSMDELKEGYGGKFFLNIKSAANIDKL
ncbi:phospholipase D family protein [Candidatus Poseidoniales archaeon]|nr:phospholipase D family protein [Candidatus Poseidoniales archaeon]